MSETDFLKLKKHDNVETNTEKFDIENYLNGNWDKINENAKKVNTDILNINSKNKEQDTNIGQLQENTETSSNKIAELEKELKEAQEDFYQNSIRGQASGEYIHVEDSSNCRARIGISGNSEQETRSGKNKIDLAKCQIKTSNGVTSTYNKENNSITFNGTCTVDNTAFHIFENWKNADDNNVLIKNNSTLLAQYVSGNVTGYSRFRLSDENWQDKIGLDLTILNSTNKKIYNTYSKSDTTIKYLSFRFEKGTVLNNFTIQLMLTDTVDTEYEMYGASPSPGYQSKIKTVGSNGSVKATKCNKNIMPINIGTNYAYTSSGIKHLNRENGTEITRFIVKKGQIIKVGLKLISKPINDTTFSFYFKSNDNTIGSFAHMERNEFELNQIYEREYTAIEDGEFFIRIWGSPFPDIFEFQLWAELDNLTEYEQHEEQSYIMPVQQEMLENDYLDYDNEEEVHTKAKLVLTGNENWILESTGRFGIIKSDLPEIPAATSNNNDYLGNMCNSYKESTPALTWKKVQGFCVDMSSSLRIYDDKYSTNNDLEGFKTYLKSQYDAGTPVIIYYKLQTPTRLAFTDEQKAVAKELNNARTYKNVTNITTDSKAILSLDYAKDQETQNQKMQNEIDEIKQLLSTTQTSALLLDNMQTDIESEVE